jgi:hypothetical protein
MIKERISNQLLLNEILNFINILKAEQILNKNKSIVLDLSFQSEEE